MTLAEMTNQVKVILEDSGETIFKSTHINSNISQCLKEVANYIPYTIKEERFTTEDSKEINVLGVVNLIDVDKAEHKVDLSPPRYRSVTRWGDYITLEIDFYPEDDESVYLFCKKAHTLVDPPSSLAGLVNKSGGYTAGASSIILDGLGTGTIKADTLVVFTGIAGEYRVTADATITTNAATISITPGLLEDMDNDIVITFRCSTFTDPRLEALFAEYVAGKVALNWVGTARTALNNAITAYGLANTQVDLITARVAQIVTDADTARTAASANFSTATTEIGKAGTALTTGAGGAITAMHNAITSYITTANTTLNTDAEAALDTLNGLIGDYTTAANQALAAIDLANGEIDQAVLDVDAHRTDLTGNDTALNTALTAITTEGSQAITDLDSAREFINTVPAGNVPESAYISAAGQQLNIIRGKVNEIQALIAEGAAYSPITNGVLSTARGFLNEATARINLEASLIREHSEEAARRIQLGQATANLGASINSEYSVETARYIQQALGYLNEARTYLEADARKVNNLMNVISAEARAIQSYASQANGYFQESNLSIRTAQAFAPLTNWGLNKLNSAIKQLTYLQAPKTRTTYSRGA